MINPNLFGPGSRYAGLATASLVTPAGQTIVYLTRRFLPSPAAFALLQEYTVTQGDRLDNVAARFIGDPEQFWRLCDANNAMRPDELTETLGRTLRITLPLGVPGQPHV